MLRIYSTAETAAKIGRNERSVRKLIARGELPRLEIREGRTLKLGVREEVLNAYISRTKRPTQGR